MSELLIDSDGAKEVLCLERKGYPSILEDIEKPPLRLYVYGNKDAIKPGLAIVGARKATPYGLACAHRFASIAAKRGIPVISGGAIGCDQAAHKGALEAGGTTIAVLGSGADVAYPKRAKGLFEQIISSGGVVISELEWGASPQKWAFVKRNRIIAGLSRAILIVEAGLPSGTFSTADFALSSNRDVLVVPGSIFSRESKGSNTLIAQGAMPIIDDTSFSEALNSIFPISSKNAMDTDDNVKDLGMIDNMQMRVLDMLAAAPMTVDQVIESIGSDTLVAMRKISALETRGMVVRYPDGRFGIDPKLAVSSII